MKAEDRAFVLVCLLQAVCGVKGQMLCRSSRLNESTDEKFVEGFYKSNNVEFVVIYPEDSSGEVWKEECECEPPSMVRMEGDVMWCDVLDVYEAEEHYDCSSGTGRYPTNATSSSNGTCFQGFYQCDDYGNKSITFTNKTTCDDGLFFNIARGVCDYSANIKECWPKKNVSCSHPGIFPIIDGKLCSGYYMCGNENNTKAMEHCMPGYAFNGDFCDLEEFVNSSICKPKMCPCQGTAQVAGCTTGMVCDEAGSQPDAITCDEGNLFDTGTKSCLRAHDVVCDPRSDVDCNPPSLQCECEGAYASVGCGVGYLCPRAGQPANLVQCPEHSHFDTLSLSCGVNKSNCETELKCGTCGCIGSYVSSRNCSVGYTCDAPGTSAHVTYCQGGTSYDTDSQECQASSTCLPEIHCYVSGTMRMVVNILVGISTGLIAFGMVMFVLRPVSTRDHTLFIGTVLASLIAAKACYMAIVANATNYEFSFGSVGALLHVFYMNVLLVMAVELTAVYMQLRSQPLPYSFLLPAYFITWAIPAVIVGATVGGNGTNSYLFLSASQTFFRIDWDSSAIYTFGVSIAVALLVVISFLAGLLWMWCRDKTDSISDGRLECDMRVCVGGTPAILATWSLATLTFSTQDDVPGGLFAAFAFLEGALLLILLWVGTRPRGRVSFFASVAELCHWEGRVGPLGSTAERPQGSSVAGPSGAAAPRLSISSWGSGNSSSASTASGIETQQTGWMHQSGSQEAPARREDILQSTEERDWWQFQQPQVHRRLPRP